MVTKNRDAVPKNMDFGPKKYIFNNNNGWSGSVPQVIVHMCHVLQCTGFPGPCAPHPSNIFVIHNNMFPKIVKKVFLKKIEKCKCYKRSSSDHQAIIERSSTSSGHNFGYRASILGPKKRKIIRIEKEKDWAR